ncbi:MAG: hypothetical protein IMHGJWDQ_001947 [Candidatus Fervidibacter sp.]
MARKVKEQTRWKMNIKRGDIVQVMWGSALWRGKRGRVIKVLPKENRLIVEGINLVWKHQRPMGRLMQGGRIQIPAPIHRSKVMLVCPHCDKPTRIKMQFLEDGRKVRACKRCGEIIDPV